MPKKVERVLRKRAKKLFPSNREKQDKYIFSTLHKLKEGKSK